MHTVSIEQEALIPGQWRETFSGMYYKITGERLEAHPLPCVQYTTVNGGVFYRPADVAANDRIVTGEQTIAFLEHGREPFELRIGDEITDIYGEHVMITDGMEMLQPGEKVRRFV